jgi:UDP-galactopyranose mutase
VKYDYLIVGAGFAGCILAERLASQLGKRILLIDKRSHIAGNAYDAYNGQGIRIHHYGPHLFHTNDMRIVDYLSQFTEWRSYQHRALAYVNGKYVPIPINRKTVNELLGLSLESESDVEEFFRQEREERVVIENSEDYVVSRVGRRLYELLYLHYTQKQWGRHPRELSPSVCGRLPIRTNLDDRYFDDKFQAIPAKGYTSMFERMIDHPNIEVQLNTRFHDVSNIAFDRLVYTGPIDEFFGYIHGKLAYRSLRFEFETHDTEYVQPVAMINYPDDTPYTRTIEFKHITGQRHPKTTLSREFPVTAGEPYYPIPSRESEGLYEKYRKEAEKLRTVTFVGRLATYRYYNMDQVTAQALKVFEEMVRR